MATRRVVTRADDLDGSLDAHTVRFGLDGREYEIDLTDAHAQQFREVLAPYVTAGRRLTRSGRPYVRVDLDHRATARARRSAAAQVIAACAATPSLGTPSFADERAIGARRVAIGVRTTSLRVTPPR